ncbi:DUF551 domain-containing protein [Escherichia coli]|uniref:DUF551 domain-containing protein n=1 Tax=Escherichia coli TaxID=562 RepID=UPI001325FF30|nr:DUF551 domain-containing protein [Escherichia coli]MBY7297266.1 DUF551 domain-containing protein [Escherichia coli]MXG40642.1 DUF551 domain-containing protein [Escherichia coli]MXG63206.1 DUF551 domain-containing protein [Escherichia coli]HDT3196380.1 DUF551 domain-containing protein [Escherichia coli]
MINRTKLEHILEYARQQRRFGQHCKIPPGDMVEIVEIAMRKTGNYPVTPDGWISCSERMPDKLIPVMVMYEDGEMWSAMWNGNRWDDGTEYPDPHSVTHWREMPAAPKQEVNRG